ncbi:MAG: alpha/beta hydrolase [Chloroflexi bacterium]|nr:alpha/beta hydrolase [Chloroflexota bacterium]
MSTNIEHMTVRTNGINLHVVLSGPVDGPAIILLHGFPEFWRGWIKQIQPLTDRGYRVIVPDQRGYNLSEVPGLVADYGLDKLSADVIGLMDHFGIKQANLAGHDWGAAVAWNTGMQYPERIRKLAILNVPHPAVMLRFISRSPSQMLKSWYIGFFQIPGLADWLLSRRNFSAVVQMLRSSGLPTSFSSVDLDEYRQAYTNSGGLTGMINWYRALLRYRPAAPQNMRLSMPVRILWGRKDVALSAEMAEESLKLCDQGELFFFENATHWVQHDQPQAVADHLLEFFI